MAGITSIALSAYNTVNAFESQRQQGAAAMKRGQYEAAIDRQNATIADMQAADAITRGTIAEDKQRFATNQEIGATRASLAGQGVDVGSGSAATVQGTEAGLGELDALTIRNNAARESWGYKVEAQNDTNQANVAEKSGELERDAANFDSIGTLINGAANTYGLFRSYRNDPSRRITTQVPRINIPRTKGQG